MSKLRDGELGKVCIPLSSECTSSENCADQISDNYDDYLKGLDDGCYD